MYYLNSIRRQMPLCKTACMSMAAYFLRICNSPLTTVPPVSSAVSSARLMSPNAHHITHHASHITTSHITHHTSRITHHHTAHRITPHTASHHTPHHTAHRITPHTTPDDMFTTIPRSHLWCQQRFFPLQSLVIHPSDMIKNICLIH